MTKINTIIIFCVFALSLIHTYGQSRITKAAKVILVFNEKSETISRAELFGNFQNTSKETALKKYPNSKFFIGLLQGSYHLKDGEVIPNVGATITIYTQKQYLWNEPISWSEAYSAGDGLSIGHVKTRVLSSKKGELILRTQ